MGVKSLSICVPETGAMADFYLICSRCVLCNWQKLYTGIPSFIVLCRYCVFFFYKLKVCGNLALSQSIGAIFQITLAHFVSMLLFGNSANVSNIFVIIIFVMMIYDW